MLWVIPRVVFLSGCLNLVAAPHAQTLKDIKFESLSLQDDLSQVVVSSITQDHQGFMWFGTSEGLYRYDGYGFSVYRSRVRAVNVLSDDWITSLYEDQAGALWIGTQSGVLNRLDPTRERVTHYDLRDHSKKATSQNSLPPLKSFTYSLANPSTITAIIANRHDDRDRSLWISTWGHGLYRLVFTSESQPFGDSRRTQRETREAHQENVQIVHYQHDPSDPKSLSSNGICALYEDTAGALWIGTFGGGANRFDQTTATFTRYQHNSQDSNSLSDNRVLSIVADKSGALWLGTFGGGLNKLVLNSSNTQVYASSATDGQCNRHEREILDFIHYSHVPTNPESLSDNDVTAILEDRYGTLWIGTSGGGLNQFDQVQGKFKHYKDDPQDLHSLGDNEVLTLYEDRSGVIWVGTYPSVGLSKFNRSPKAFTHYRHDPTDASSLSDRVVTSIYAEPDSSRGQTGIIWIGTRRGGLNKFDRAINKFTHYRHDPANPHCLSQDRISAICGDGAGALWIGTYDEGLNHLDTESGKVTRYQHNPFAANSLSNNQIRALHQDKSGTLWIGTFGGGLDQLRKGRKNFVHYRYARQDSNSISDDRVSCIYEGRRGTLWIGMFGGGLNRLVISTGGAATAEALSEKMSSEHERVRFIRYRHDPGDSTSLSDDHVLTIYEDKLGRLWIGTLRGGLNHLDQESGKFEDFTKTTGLPSDLIYGILEDDRSNLWLSTSQGLAKLDPQSLAVKTYTEHDGLQSQKFSYGAYYKSSSGEMFFGGVNGLNSFWPDSIKGSAYVPPLVITVFKKFDHAIKAVNGEIVLPHKDNFFSIEFAALDYTSPEENQYAYKLEGFDDDWVYCGTRRYANYQKVAPGRYIFRVKGSNHDGLWNENGASLRITIHPPFWKTWWFLALSLMGIVFSLALLHERRVKQRIKSFWQVEQARKQENEQIRKQIARDFHDEFGHKLTNISLFTEILKQNLCVTSPQDLKYLNKISDASRSLSKGIRDFIWTLDPQKDSFYDVAIRLKDFGDSLYSNAGIDFRVKGIDKKYEEVDMSMAWRRYLTLIFKESMGYLARQPECKNVTLEIACVQKNVALTLTYVSANLNGGPEHLTHWGEMKKYAHEIGGELIITAGPKGEHRMQFLGKIPP